MVKLRFERQKPRQSGEGFVLVAEEMELEVHPSEGLEIFKFQVHPPTPRAPADDGRLVSAAAGHAMLRTTHTMELLL